MERRFKDVLAIAGSPRKGGNSDILCDEFLHGAGVYQKGEVSGTKAMQDAYRMGKNI